MTDMILAEDGHWEIGTGEFMDETNMIYIANTSGKESFSISFEEADFIAFYELIKTARLKIYMREQSK